MLSLITPLRGLVVLFGWTVIAAAWPPRPTAWQPRPTAREYYFGEIEPGSIELTNDGGTFVMHRRGGSDSRLTVHFDGALSRTVCNGVTVAVEGAPLSQHDVEALEVSGFHEGGGGYDTCWELRCDAEAYARCGRAKLKFE